MALNTTIGTLRTSRTRSSNKICLLSLAVIAACNGQALAYYPDDYQNMDDYIWTGTSGSQLTSSGNWAWLQPDNSAPVDLSIGVTRLVFDYGLLPDIGGPYSILNASATPNITRMEFYGGGFDLSGSEIVMGGYNSSSSYTTAGFVNLDDMSSVVIGNDVSAVVNGLPHNITFRAVGDSDLTLDGDLAAAKLAFTAGDTLSSGDITVNGALGFLPYQPPVYANSGGNPLSTGSTTTPYADIDAIGDSTIEINSDIIDPNAYLDTAGSYLNAAAFNNSTVVINGNVVMDKVILGAYSGTVDNAGSVVTVNGDITTSELEFTSQGSKVLTGTVTIDGRDKQWGSIDPVSGQPVIVQLDTSANKTITGQGSISLTGAAGAILDSRSVSNGTGHQFNLYNGASLNLDNSTAANSNRLADSMNIDMGEDATVALLGNDTTAVNETVGAIHLRRGTIDSNVESYYNLGESSIHIDNGAAGASLTADGLQIDDYRWLNISIGTGQTLGSGPAFMLNNAPVLNNGLVDDVLVNRKEFASYDGVNGVIAATTTTDINTATAGDNVLVDTSTALGGTATVKSLAVAADITGAGAINVTSGNLLMADGVTNSVAADVNFGAAEGRMQAFGDTNLNGTLTAGNGLLVRGDGDVSVNALVLTGDMHIQQAGLSVESNLTLSNNDVLLTQGRMTMNGDTANSAGNSILSGLAADYSYYRSGNRNSELINGSGTFTNNGTIRRSDTDIGVGGLDLINEGGTLVNQNNGVMYVDTLTNNGGTVTNNAVISATTLNNNGGNLTSTDYISGGIVNDLLGIVDLSGHSRASINNVSGTVTMTASSNHVLYGITNAGNFNNAGRISPEWEGGGFITNLESGTFSNTGTIRANGADIRNEGNFYNSGSISMVDETYGYCTDPSDIDTCGSFEVYAGEIYSSGNGNFQNSGTVYSESSVYATDGGKIDNYGAITARRVVVNAYDATAGGGTFVNRNTGTIAAETSVYNGGQLNNSGQINGEVSVSGTGSTLTNNNSGVITRNVEVHNGGTVNNAGSINGLTVSHGGVASNSGVINRQLVVRGGINNTPDAVFTNSGTVNTNSSVLNSIDGSVVNEASGTITFRGTTSVDGTIQNGGTVDNRGDLVVGVDGEINGSGIYNQLGGSTVVNGTLMQSDINVMGGTLGGSGTVVGNVLVGPNGLIIPGNSPGLLTVDGDFMLEEGGRLNLEIDGLSEGEFDQLLVTGTFSAAGRINFILGDGLDETIFTSDDPEVDPLMSLLDIFYVGEDATNNFDLSMLALVSMKVNTSSGDAFSMSLVDDGNGGFTSSVSAVPVPAAIWLFASGLISLVGLARCKQFA